MWKSKLTDICNSFGIEVIQKGLTLIFHCPDEPDENLKTDIQLVVPPGITVNYKVSPKENTIKDIQNIIYGASIPGTSDLKITHNTGKDLVIKVTGNIKLDDEDINYLNKLVKSDRYYNTFEIYVNNIKVSFLADEIAQNNTIHDRVIQKDDITDLRILLGNTNNVYEFFAKVGIECNIKS